MSQKLIQLSRSPYEDVRRKEVLSHIREVYGNTTQILVSNEELCELAAVCAKFPRYTDPGKARTELRSAAIDEVADVMIILDHIINIFQLEDIEVWRRIGGKVDRISRWLSESSNQEQTTVDREVKESTIPSVPCGGCGHFGNFQNLKPGHRCCQCASSGYTLFEPKPEENPTPQVTWSQPGECPVTPEQFEKVWEDADGNDS